MAARPGGQPISELKRGGWSLTARTGRRNSAKKGQLSVLQRSSRKALPPAPRQPAAVLHRLADDSYIPSARRMVSMLLFTVSPVSSALLFSFGAEFGFASE